MITPHCVQIQAKFLGSNLGKRCSEYDRCEAVVPPRTITAKTILAVQMWTCHLYLYVKLLFTLITRVSTFLRFGEERTGGKETVVRVCICVSVLVSCSRIEVFHSFVGTRKGRNLKRRAVVGWVFGSQKRGRRVLPPPPPKTSQTRLCRLTMCTLCLCHDRCMLSAIFVVDLDEELLKFVDSCEGLHKNLRLSLIVVPFAA